MQLNAKENIIIKNNLKIKKVVDGDGLIVENIFNNQEFEIRFLGIDAPELKSCRKLAQDERETHLAAQFLMELGRKSLKYLLEIAPPNTNVSILVENENEIDLYGRTLAYVFLEDGTCLNEIMIKEGFAKPYNRYFCKELSKYQILNLNAKNEQKGLFAFSKNW
ncbi:MULTISPECIES: thermonuclease family protein [unclassified Flavobacterium]|uniref:thermonuclease family protein n=1 Tax=unclassified Flavobacterium TaxID=196869 RepID=UPI00131C63C0|nr:MULTISPECIES: thermonuclease family protein [unclassified Flavobacterium]